MKLTKNAISIFAYLIIFTLMLSQVSYSISAAISPASMYVKYSDASGGKVVKGSFNVINSDTSEGAMTAIAQSPYIKITSDKIFTIKPGGSYPVSFEVALPDDFTPGKTSMIITTTKAPEGGANFGIAVALNYVVFVEKPYPDEYVEASVSDIRVVEKDAKLTVTGANKGSFPITGAKAFVTIFDNAGVAIDNLQSSEGEIPLETSTPFALAWNAPKTGSYPIEAWVGWGADKKSKAVKGVLRIGEESLEITSPPTQIIGGSIQPYKIQVTSIWNEPLPADALLRIFGKDGKTVLLETVRSATSDVGGWETKEFMVYVDTTSLEMGAYNAQIEVTFNNKKVVKDFTLEVVSKITDKPVVPKPVVNNTPTTPPVTNPTTNQTTPSFTPTQTSGSGFEGMLMVVVALVILAAIYMVFIGKKQQAPAADGEKPKAGDNGAQGNEPVAPSQKQKDEED